MPVRNEHNAIIFAGTMGLIRKSVLEEIGGWDEWCITEDAETSLRILKRGYQSLYIKKTFGHGLMPFDFEGLKKQRFRWCFGGIQILKKHWEALMPWAHWVDPDNRLTFSQRYFYLAGGLQWFTDVLNLLFALFLIAGAVFSTISTPLQVRPLTGPLLIMPAVFLLLHMWRFVWVLRHKLGLTFSIALRTMYNFFSLGWAVTLAAIQGLVQNEGVFLRTPKSKSRSRMWRAIRVTQWESLIGLSCLGMGILAFISHPSLRTFFLGSLLLWQSSLYLAAPVYSMLSVRHGQMDYRADRGKPIVENWAARWALGLAAVLIGAAGVLQLLPAPSGQPQYAQYEPIDVPPERLLGIDRVPIESRTTPPTPTQTMPATRTETSAEIFSPPPTTAASQRSRRLRT